MGRLFGTDGARGVANKELTCEIAYKIGKATAMVLAEGAQGRPQILIGKDTRISSDMLEAALTAGLCSVGADVLSLGVVPTPAVAYLVKELGCNAGIMISASHNPAEYNGIKLFNHEGYKLPDSVEEEIEAIVIDNAKQPPEIVGEMVGTVKRVEAAVDKYIEHVASSIDGDLSGMKIALDCANGSASATAEKLFKALNADCIIINAEPNGININKDCGSTHLEQLQKAVVDNGCEIGLAFDGDADRMLAVDANGEQVDGDKIIAICAKHLKDCGKLANDTVVVTVMSNMGLYKFCEEYGMKYETTKVGDRYVLENMKQYGHSIGGEQSGHIIFLDHASTGDGQLSGVQLLNVVKTSGKSIKELATLMTTYPQVLVNVRVSPEGKAAFDTNEAVQQSIKDAEAKLNGDGRVLVRMSGTEPLIRVMLEGSDYALIEKLANDVAQVIKEQLS